MLVTPVPSYRTIDPVRDADLAYAHHREACVASFGERVRCQSRGQYLAWLRSKLDEFPEGYLLAMVDGTCAGQLELEVPYGLATGYVNLFYVSPEFRGTGFAQRLHQRAELYFTSWEAIQIDLHVSPRNARALRFYQKLGYRRIISGEQDAAGGLWRLRRLTHPHHDQAS